LNSHTAAVPADSKDGHIYHDGVILDGVKDDGTGHYVKNDVVLSATDYYASYIHDMGEWFQPDKLFRNDYIKLREVALTYTFSKAIAQKIRFQKLALTVFGRNLFYLYKTLPNIDPESSLGSASFVEYSALPQIRTIGFKLDASF
jgi:iron complex outermembrane receptor protein